MWRVLRPLLCLLALIVPLHGAQAAPEPTPCPATAARMLAQHAAAGGLSMRFGALVAQSHQVVSPGARADAPAVQQVAERSARAPAKTKSKSSHCNSGVSASYAMAPPLTLLGWPEKAAAAYGAARATCVDVAFLTEGPERPPRRA